MKIHTMMTLNGMFSEPKPHRVNFIKENKRKLKHFSNMLNPSVKHSKVDVIRSQTSQTDIGQQAHNSSSRIAVKPSSSYKLSRKSTITVFMRDKKRDEVPSVTTLFPRQRSSHKSVSVSRNQSSQTIDPKNYDQLFHEGTILYPSSKILEEIAEMEKAKANRLDVHVKKEFFKKNRLKSGSASKNSIRQVTSSKKGLDGKRSEGEENESENKSENKPDHKTSEISASPKKKESDGKMVNKPKTKGSAPSLNAADIIRKTTEDHLQYSPRSNQQNMSERSVPSNRGDSNSSHIPKIVKKTPIKKDKKEESDMLKTVFDPMCPPGHIPLPDQDRKKTLHMLRANYAELIREMNLLPVRTDTLRIRQRKIQLENQLNKIEEGIKVFNKSKVYVKIEE